MTELADLAHDLPKSSIKLWGQSHLRPKRMRSKFYNTCFLPRVIKFSRITHHTHGVYSSKNGNNLKTCKFLTFTASSEHTRFTSVQKSNRHRTICEYDCIL